MTPLFHDWIDLNYSPEVVPALPVFFWPFTILYHNAQDCKAAAKGFIAILTLVGLFNIIGYAYKDQMVRALWHYNNFLPIDFKMNCTRKLQYL